MKAKNGISLIVLVITIVVVIILAAAVILSLGENNPINDARAANLANSQDNIASAIVNLVGNRLAKYATTSSSTEALLTADGITGEVAILSGTKGSAKIYDGTAEDGSDRTKITGLLRIGNGGDSDTDKAANSAAWAALNLKDPGNEWYYSVDTGKVYVFLGETKPSWSNKTTDAMILVAEPTPST